MKANTSKAAMAVAAAALLSACASPYPPATEQRYPAPNQGHAYYAPTGVVDSIQVVQRSSGTSGTGGVLGGVVGGLLGNQIGGGSGRAAATVAGVVGGAVVGNQIEKGRQGPNEVYQVGVRLENGSYATVTQENLADLRIGDRVRIENDRLTRY